MSRWAPHRHGSSGDRRAAAGPGRRARRDGGEPTGPRSTRASRRWSGCRALRA